MKLIIHRYIIFTFTVKFPYDKKRNTKEQYNTRDPANNCHKYKNLGIKHFEYASFHLPYYSRENAK